MTAALLPVFLGCDFALLPALRSFFLLCHVREIQLQHAQPNTQKMKYCGISMQSRSYSWTDGQNHNSPELGLRGSALDHLPQ